MPFTAPTLRALAGAILVVLLSPTVHATGDTDPQQTPRDNSTTLSGIQVEANVAAPTAAYAGDQVARGGRFGVLGNQDAMNVPFASTSYTDTLIRNQQARTLGDVVSNDAAVRTGFGFGNFSQTFTIRGFQLYSDDIAFDGLYGLLPRQLLAPELVSRVEVFKGSSAFLNGISPGGSGIGGSINIAPKRAEAQPITRVGLDWGSDSQVGASVDLGRRFGAGDAFGVRVNAVHRDGNTGIDGEQRRVTAASVAFDYRGDKLRVTTDLGYQKQVITGGRAVVYASGLTAVPRAPSARTNYAQPWSNSSLEDTFGVVRAEYDFAPWITGYVAAGAHHGNEFGDYVSPTLLDRAGNAKETRFTVPYIADTATGEAGVNMHFDTGEVSHRVNVGFSALTFRKKAAYAGSLDPIQTNLYAPTYVPVPAFAYNVGPISDPGITGRTQLRSLAVSDTLGFLDDSLELTLGARRQKLHVLGYNYAVNGVDGAKNAEYEQYATSPVIGLNYRIAEQWSVYANHIEALTQGDQAPETFNNRPVTNAGQVFAPYKAKQNEVGVKWDAGTVGSSLALFQIKQPSAYVDTSNTYVVDGEQRNRGIEWNVFGQPTEGVRVLGGVNYIRPELVKTQGGTNEGNDAIGVPRFQANAGVEWDLPNVPDVTLSARAVHTGKQYLDAANTLKVPAWTTYDLGARTTTHLEGVPVTFRLTVQNVANKGYWASANGGYLTQGTPRTFYVSASFDL
ncbi:TonB-dependent receptor [Luteibacter sp. UNCMF366Tsu5.1]|uniref:TonB-dependent receptor n=1 Tax=Luteibacter sp. UNCMF366Tsu5.1 TaxID=1502758 RepID=UPI00090850A3|nr:TonB-dependent siderophore receptor [Luteibacter sp. UNCMF366Tsu5.1]SFW25361.1 iron complex outermembrane recepter protein [Luteibacter sp. UNCMF366Tsu5.1]